MRLLDRLILMEFVGPFLFGTAMFSSLLMAAIYLFGLTDYFVNGIPILLVLQLMALLLPGLVGWTFPMASLLAVLLGFGRLSSDSELIAAFASGVSLRRIMFPVALAGIIVSGVALLFSEEIVPRASIRAALIKTEILSRIGENRHVISGQQLINGKLAESWIATGSNPSLDLLYNVHVTGYDQKTGREIMIVDAKKAYYKNGQWTFEDATTINNPFGQPIRSHFDFADVQPKAMQIPKSPRQLAIDMVPEENLSSNQIQNRIDEKARNGEQINGLQVEYYNKFALPLASAVFCFLAAPLGMRDPRRGGAALGWISAIFIIILYWITMRFMGVLGNGGKIPPWTAAFAPDILGLCAAVALVWKRSR